MAITVKPIAQVVAKWNTRAQGAGQNYQDGINNPKNSPTAQAIAQAPVWLEGVTTAGVNGYKKGLERSGDTKWKTNSLGKGKDRFPGGISQAQPAYQARMGQVLNVISGVTLPQKLPRGNPSNMARATAVAAALAAAKKQGWE